MAGLGSLATVSLSPVGHSYLHFHVSHLLSVAVLCKGCLKPLVLTLFYKNSYFSQTGVNACSVPVLTPGQKPHQDLVVPLAWNKLPYAFFPRSSEVLSVMAAQQGMKKAHSKECVT